MKYIKLFEKYKKNDKEDLIEKLILLFKKLNVTKLYVDDNNDIDIGNNLYFKSIEYYGGDDIEMIYYESNDTKSMLINKLDVEYISNIYKYFEYYTVVELIKKKYNEIVEKYKLDKIYFKEPFTGNYTFTVWVELICITKDLKTKSIVVNCRSCFDVKIQIKPIENNINSRFKFTYDTLEQLYIELCKLTKKDLEQQIANQEGEGMGFFDLKTNEGRYKIYENVVPQLNVTADGLLRLPKLPNNLEYLYCDLNNLTYLPKLPNTLKELDCTDNDIISLPKLPESLEELCCNYNRIRTLPELPPKLTRLECRHNYITELPKLTDTLEYLYCDNNNLTYLPELPNTLEELDCDDNDWKEPIKKEYIEKFRILPYTKEQIELFSGEEFQRGFLTEKPERYEDISCGGIVVHPEIRKEFSYLWEGEGMGFFKMNKQ